MLESTAATAVATAATMEIMSEGGFHVHVQRKVIEAFIKAYQNRKVSEDIIGIARNARPSVVGYYDKFGNFILN